MDGKWHCIRAYHSPYRPSIVSCRNHPPTGLALTVVGSLLSQKMQIVQGLYVNCLPGFALPIQAFVECLAQIINDDDELDKMVDSLDMLVGSFFTGLPMAWFVDIMHSTDLNVKLGCKRIPRSRFQKLKMEIFDRAFPMRTNYRFWIMHNDGCKAGVMMK